MSSGLCRRHRRRRLPIDDLTEAALYGKHPASPLVHWADRHPQWPLPACAPSRWPPIYLRIPSARGTPRGEGAGVPWSTTSSHSSTPLSLASRQSPLCETTCRLSVCALAVGVVSTLETVR